MQEWDEGAEESGEPERRPAEPRQPETRVVASEDLFRGAREIIIRHAGEDYRLRLTRVGKLILNK